VTTFERKYKDNMETKFADWLNAELSKRDWSQAELARRSGLSRQAISYYFSEKSKQPDEFALQHLAKAFKLPIEQVYRAAGALPPNKGTSEEIEQIIHEAEGMTKDEQLELLSYIRWRNNQRKKK
jgi:transcriptional regulator with XRE-family HTH domain